VATDVVGDYAFPHDTYDNLANSSPEQFGLPFRSIYFSCQVLLGNH